MSLQPVRILGIYRNPVFSNNAIEVDRLILEESLAQLEKASHVPLHVQMAEESEIPKLNGEFSLVLTMAQAPDSLDALEKVLPTSPIWNSPTAIRSCYRKSMSRILSAIPSVGYVPFQLLPTGSSVSAELKEGESYWLKRSDFHAISDEDVSLAESPAEVEAKLKLFRGRGVSEVILQRHIHGDIYKFYGVRGKFFRPIKVRSFLKGPVALDLTQLEAMASRSAEALGLMVYGGDAILDASGKFHMIDVNDWPSFRLCREDASKAIASLGLEFLSQQHVFRRGKAAAITASLL